MTRPQEASDALWLGLGSVGVAAIGLALTGTTGNPLLAMALSTTAGITGGQLFLQPQARKEIFKSGANAVGCLLTATSPLADADSRANNLLKPRLDHLTLHLATLAQANAQLTSKLNEASADEKTLPLWNAATIARDGVADIVTRAEAVYASGEAIVVTVDGGGDAIRTALVSIRTAVTAAALSTAPDLASLQNSLRSIQVNTKDALGFLIPTGAAQDSVTNKTPAVKNAQAARDIRDMQARGLRGAARLVTDPWVESVNTLLSKLVAEIGAVEADIQAIHLVAPTIQVGNVSGAIHDCIIQAQSTPELRQFTITPTSTFTLKPGDSATAGVSGGSGSFSTEALWDTKTDVQVTASSSTAGITKLQLQVGSKVSSGLYRLLVSDVGSGIKTSQIVNIIVSASSTSSSPLSASPARANLSAREGANVSVSLAGGKPPYNSLGPSESDEQSKKALKVALGTDKVSLTITATKDAVSGATYKTRVSDAAGQVIEVEVVMVAATPAALSVSPASVTLDATPGSSQPFAVSGGTPPYTSRGPQEDDSLSAAALKVSPTGETLNPDKPLLTVTMTSEAKPGMTYKTWVADAAAHVVGITITTKGGAAAGAVGSKEASATLNVITRVQRSLRERLYDPGPIDGRAGPMTRRALREFQRDHGLEADGVLTGKTRSLLGLE